MADKDKNLIPSEEEDKKLPQEKQEEELFDIDEEDIEEVKTAASSYAHYSSMAFQMVATILVGVFLGLKLDEWLNTAPWFTISLTLLSVVVAMVVVIRGVINPEGYTKQKKTNSSDDKGIFWGVISLLVLFVVGFVAGMIRNPSAKSWFNESQLYIGAFVGLLVVVLLVRQQLKKH